MSDANTNAQVAPNNRNEGLFIKRLEQQKAGARPRSRARAPSGNVRPLYRRQRCQNQLRFDICKPNDFSYD